MFKIFLTALVGAGALALVPAPAIAQDKAEGMEQTLGALGAMFEVEPLTPEQEARLPLARAIMQKVMPEGTLQDVMGGMLDGMFGPMMALDGDGSESALADALGYSPDDLGMSEEATREVLGIVDPAWQSRREAADAASGAIMLDMMGRMEPVMRDVMTELYAIYFDEAQLADIDAFFSTETGQAYARQSYSMASDPRIIAAMFSDPDLLLGAITDMPAQLESAMEGMPAPRGFDDLAPEEKARLMALTGLSAQEVAETMDGSTGPQAAK